MREKYTTPEMEIIEFEVEDIITGSLPGSIPGPTTDNNETLIVRSDV